MKAFKSVVMAKAPVDRVWCTVRDRLPELATAMEDIERVVVTERKMLEDGLLSLVNQWYARQGVPQMFQNALGTETIGWTDRNVWDDARRECRWTIEPWVLREAIQCQGVTRYETAMGGKGARIVFEGSFELSNAAVTRLGGAFAAPLTPFIESIVTTLIPKNLRKIVEAAALVHQDGAPLPSADQSAVVKAQP